jgi:PAS domain S-box-containing protein
MSPLSVPPPAPMYQRLVESLTEYAVLMLDIEGIVISWNSGAERLLGYTSEDVVGKSVAMLYKRNELQSQPPRALLDHALQNDGMHTFSLNAVRRNGEVLAVSATLNAIYDTRYDARRNAHRTMEGFVVVLRNASEPENNEHSSGLDASKYDVYAGPSPDFTISPEQALKALKHDYEKRLNQRTDLLQEAILQLQEEVAKRDDIESKLRQRTEIMHDFIQQLEQEMDERKHIETTLRASEEGFRAVIERSPIGICIANEHGLIEYANSAYCTAIGFSPLELTGTPVAARIRASAQAAFDKEFQASFQLHGQPPASENTEHGDDKNTHESSGDLRGEWEFIHKNGTTVTTLIDATPLQAHSPYEHSTHSTHSVPATHSAGHAVRPSKQLASSPSPAATRKMIIFVMDITQRKHAEDLYKRAKVIIDQSPAVIYQFANRPGFPIEFVSDNIIQFGYTPDDIVTGLGGSASRLWFAHPDDLAATEQLFRVLRTKKVYHLRREFRLRTKDGSYRWVENNIVASRDTDTGAITHYQGVLFDITDRKAAEEELNRALAKERELLDLKGRFITIASHEFRTPLTSIMLAAGILKDFGSMLTDEQRDDNLILIRTSVDHMTQLLEDLFMFDRVDSAAMTFKESDIELTWWTTDFLTRKQASVGKNHHVNFTVPDEEVSYTGDESMLRQMLDRMLANAFKFSAAGTDVDVTLTISEHNAVFTVRDSGIGIPVEDHEHIFEPFHRGSNIGEIGGTGMGLAILSKLAELHGGTVHLESEVNVGTTFTLSVPLNAADVFSQTQSMRKNAKRSPVWSSESSTAAQTLQL